MRHGMSWAVMNRLVVNIVRYRNIVLLSVSFEKLVGGAIRETMRSCPVAKSAMLFCRSRILRKKSLEVSEAGRMVDAGARAGPVYS